MAEEKDKTTGEGARAPERDAGRAAGSVQYGRTESVRAGVGIGRDEEPHTAGGDAAPEASGRGASGADDHFVSSEVQGRASERGPRSKTTS